MDINDYLLDSNEEVLEFELQKKIKAFFDNYCDWCENSPCKCEDTHEEQEEFESHFRAENLYDMGGAEL